MNNSSAYNNVLLKPAVQTQATQSSTSIVKRNYEDDASYASFQQNFKDAHEQVRPQNEKPVKSAVKKAAQVDNRKPTNEVERKPAAPAKQTEDSRPRDQVAGSDNKSDQNDHLANQNSDSSANCGKESGDKDAERKTATTDDVAKDEVTTDIANPLVTAPVVSDSLVGLALPAEVIAAGVTNVTSIIESGFNLPTSLTSSEAPIAIGDSSDATPIAQASVQTADQAILNAVETAATSASTTTNAATTLDQQAAIDLSSTQITPVEIDPLSSQITQATTPIAAADTVAEVAPIVLAAAGAGIVPKPASASIPVTFTVETSDADVVTTLASVLTPEASTTKTATQAATPDTAVTTDTAPAQTLDVKSTFEKMMQNVARPESGARDEAQPAPAAPQTASNSSSTNSLDSLFRFSEAQTPAARSFVVQTAVPVPVGQPQWSQAVGDKVLWLAAQNVSSAEIHLNPENLGPMQVKVSVNQEHATVNFTSHHAVVREVLDQNLGRLRDMFSEQGLNLVNVDVSDKSFNRQQGEAKEQKGQAGNSELAVDEEVQATASAIVQKRLVDHYA